MSRIQSAINFKNLPDDAINELTQFYNYLIHKYKKKKKKISGTNILRDVDKMSWNMGKKLYKSREELYER